MEEERKIWQTPPKTFNDWRRKNDLPQLINFFKESLPHFQEWQEEFSVPDETILQSNQTSEFFVGDGVHAFFSYYNPWHWDKEPEIKSKPISSFESMKEWADTNNKKIKGDDKFQYELFTEFVPYFDWLRSSKKINKFEVQSSHGTSAQFDDFRYNYWTADPQHSLSAEIFGKFNVVNLGQTRIYGGLIRDKNLDFTNLDGLQIYGHRVMGTTYSKIRYASCRGLTLTKLDMPFLELERCHLDDINIINCDMQDLHFIQTEGDIRRIYNSRLTKLKFEECCPIRMFTDISRGDMPDFEFINHRSIRSADKYHFFSKMRKAAQDFGYSHLAQENYYLERKYKLLSEIDPERIPVLREIRISKFLSIIKRNGIRLDKSFSYSRNRLKFIINAIKRQGSFTKQCSTVVKTILEFGNYILWGFGEKPWRLVFWGLADILGFGFVYHHFHFQDSLGAGITHSVYVLSTIGYDSAMSEFLKYIVAVQALSGVLLLGLFLAALVNKVRY